MRLSKIMVCCLLFLTLPCLLRAQAKGGQEAPESLRRFVQKFYDWYIPKALSESTVPASDQALNQRSSAFGPALVRALKADSEAQAKVKGVTVGLDFDPFLNTQDPCERYEVGQIIPKGASYWVDIYGVCSGKKQGKPDVVAELLQKDGAWLFVNFHYPKDKDLLTVLKLLRENRQKPPKR